MKFSLTIFSTSTVASQMNHLDDIQAGLSNIQRELAMGTLGDVVKGRDGRTIGEWKLTATASSSYVYSL